MVKIPSSSSPAMLMLPLMSRPPPVPPNPCGPPRPNPTPNSPSELSTEPVFMPRVAYRNFLCVPDGLDGAVGAGAGIRGKCSEQKRGRELSDALQETQRRKHR
uniref:Uncharacterized protein n=1 Tax=Anopheles coluzzii TaxID=1518534 RepID=A0A8W7PU85_ANOCL